MLHALHLIVKAFPILERAVEWSHVPYRPGQGGFAYLLAACGLRVSTHYLECLDEEAMFHVGKEDKDTRSATYLLTPPNPKFPWDLVWGFTGSPSLREGEKICRHPSACASQRKGEACILHARPDPWEDGIGASWVAIRPRRDPAVYLRIEVPKDIKNPAGVVRLLLPPGASQLQPLHVDALRACALRILRKGYSEHIKPGQPEKVRVR